MRRDWSDEDLAPLPFILVTKTVSRVEPTRKYGWEDWGMCRLELEDSVVVNLLNNVRDGLLGYPLSPAARPWLGTFTRVCHPIWM